MYSRDTKGLTYLDILLDFAFNLYIILSLLAILQPEKHPGKVLRKNCRFKIKTKISPTKQTKACICP